MSATQVLEQPELRPPHRDLERNAFPLLAHVARQACRLVGADGAVVTVADRGRAELRVVAARGRGDALLGHAFPADLGLTGRACSAGRPVLAGAGERFGIPGETPRPDALRAVAAAPIHGDDGIWGAVTILADAPLAVREADVLEDLDGLSALASAAVHSAGEARLRGEALDTGAGALGMLLDLRDGYTGDHTGEVVRLCRETGRRMGLGAAALDVLHAAARLHDLGKIGVPDEILHKPGPLTGDDWEIMRRHPEWGAAALNGTPVFEAVARAGRAHHERWDGEGYPDGLAGEAIPLAGRIITACDAFQAMRSNRPYRRALDLGEAVRRVRAGAGSQFDPSIAEALTAVLAAGGDPAVEADEPEPAAAGAPGARRAGAGAGGGRFARPGHLRRGGKALAEALARATRLPALNEPRDRVLRMLDAQQPDPQAIIPVIESSIGLTLAVLREGGRAAPGGARSVPEAVRHLDAQRLRAVVEGVPTIDFFQRVPGIAEPLGRIRLHAVATRRAAGVLAQALLREDRDQLLVAALLHDVGKLVLEQAYDAYPGQIHAGAHTPGERLDAERAQLGLDHAALGGVLLRRWEIDEEIVATVEQHHAADATGAAGIVQLADMLAHYAQARPVDPRALLAAGRRLGLTPAHLRAVMFELSQDTATTVRATRPSPLTGQEQAVLRQLATGKVYKEIGAALGIASSTVRSHCQSIYRKLDVIDRANAVLTAAEQGWI
jgi:putative nucleotidyltransferase with HDIG domain